VDALITSLGSLLPILQGFWDFIVKIISYPPLQVFLLVVAGTQLIKQYVREHNKTVYSTTIRLMAGGIGAIGSLFLIEASVNGFLYGIIISGVAAILYKLLTLFLNRANASDWQKNMATWLSGK